MINNIIHLYEKKYLKYATDYSNIDFIPQLQNLTT